MRNSLGQPRLATPHNPNTMPRLSLANSPNHPPCPTPRSTPPLSRPSTSSTRSPPSWFARLSRGPRCADAPQNCHLGRRTLSICISMIERGVNPEALAQVIKELRHEGQLVVQGQAGRRP